MYIIQNILLIIYVTAVLLIPMCHGFLNAFSVIARLMRFICQEWRPNIRSLHGKLDFERAQSYVDSYLLLSLRGLYPMVLFSTHQERQIDHLILSLEVVKLLKVITENFTFNKQITVSLERYCFLLGWEKGVLNMCIG